MRAAAFAIGFLALTCSSPTNGAQEPVEELTSTQALHEASTAYFELALDKLPSSQTQLVNGVEVTLRARDWPSVVFTAPRGQSPTDVTGSAACTGTFIGYGVIVLAAHCLDLRDDTLRKAFIRIDGLTVKLTCELNPNYRKRPAHEEPTPRRSEDFALCFVDTDVVLPTLQAIEYERIDTTPVGPRSPVMMMGYGCTDVAPREIGKTLRVGDAKLSIAATGFGVDGAYAQIISKGPPEPALCPGDSGGGLFTGSTAANQTAPRRVRGINSSVEEVSAGLKSRTAMFSHPTFVPWAQKWLDQFRARGAYICGLPGEPEGDACRI